MTVEELIQELQRFPAHVEVRALVEVQHEPWIGKVKETVPIDRVAYVNPANKGIRRPGHPFLQIDATTA